MAETVQYKRVDEIPYIAPEAIERQYQAIVKAPDAEPYVNVVRMVRWAEAVVRMGMRQRDERLDELRNSIRTIAAFGKDSDNA